MARISSTFSTICLSLSARSCPSKHGPLCRGRRHAVNTGRMRQYLAFVEQGGGGDVRDHVTDERPGFIRKKRRQAFVDVGVDEPVDAALADAGKIGQRDGGIVKRVGERRPVEVAAGKHLARWPQTRAGYRLRSRFRFPRSRLHVEHISDCAMHLRHASADSRHPECAVIGEMRFADLAALEQCREMAGRGLSATMRPRILNAGIECHWSATQRLQRPWRRQHPRAGQGAAHRRAPVKQRLSLPGYRSIEQGLLLLQAQRSQLGKAQRFAAADAFSAIKSLSFSNENQCEMKPAAQDRRSHLQSLFPARRDERLR